MKYEQNKESIAGKRKAKSLQWKELINLLQDQQLLRGSAHEISGGN